MPMIYGSLGSAYGCGGASSGTYEINLYINENSELIANSDAMIITTNDESTEA